MSSTSFQDLDAGQKLSLKGKLFELGKKLTLIDEEQKNISSYKFHPDIGSYDLPNRQQDFISNIDKAEAIRKQKLQMMKANLEREQRDGLTFSPVLNKRPKSHASSQPAHERLSQKAVEYRKNRDNNIKKSKEYDLTDGKKLFQPELVSSRYVDLPSNISADEFLYRDARDREERMRLLRKYANDDEHDRASASKINNASETLLRRKAEREVREIFDTIDYRGSKSMLYDDLRRIVDLLDADGESAYAKQYKVSERLWTVLDPDSRGVVTFHTFLSCLFPYAHRNASTMAWTDKVELTAPSQLNASTEREGPVINDTNLLLKSFFKDMMSYISREKKKAIAGDASFQPTITNRSKQLARIKESKDKQKLQEILSSSSQSTIAGKNVENLNAADLMFARHLLKKDKLNTVRKQVHDEIMGTCTFKPAINKDASSSLAATSTRNTSSLNISISDLSDKAEDASYTDAPTRRKLFTADLAAPRRKPNPHHGSKGNINSKLSSSNVHERLYAYKDKPRPVAMVSESLVQELQECTFAPKIHHSHRPRRATISMDEPIALTLAKDFDKSVNRIKQAREERLKKLAAADIDNSYNEETYKKSRELAAKGVAPFHLKTGERDLLKKKDQGRKRRYRLYVDVKVGPAQVGQIKIRDYDDPVQLARNFGRIYGLDEVACSVLASATRQSMISHGIEIGEGGNVMGIDKEISSLQSLSSSSEQDSYDQDDQGSYYDEEESEEDYY